MSKKLTAALLAVMIFACLALPAAAADDPLEDALARTLAFVADAGELAYGAEWRAIGLARGGYPLSDEARLGYFQSVRSAVANGEVSNNRLEYVRLALALKAMGFYPISAGRFDTLLSLSTPELYRAQGVNGLAWALIAINSQVVPILTDVPGLYVDALLAHQLEDGGFSLTGKLPADPDITAMVLQALAPHSGRQDVADVIEAGLGRLSALQRADGGFTTMGVANCESVAQVILAMAALGIAEDDPRFVKNGITCLDALLAYALPEGGFCHTLPESGQTAAENPMATEQALMALAALSRQRAGQSPVLVIDDVDLTPADDLTLGLIGKHPDVTPPRVVDPEAAFSDLTNSIPHTMITLLAQYGIVDGMGNGTFAPEAGLTRAQFAALTVRALGLPQGAGETAFSDVPGDAWFAPYIAAAGHYGIITGRTADTFDPHGPVTLQEAAVMVARAAKLGGLSPIRDEEFAQIVLAQYDDYRQTADWARASLAFCLQKGIVIIDGMALEPARAIDRGETAVMLFQLLAQLYLI